MLLQSRVDGSGPLDVSASDSVLGEGATLRDQYIYLQTEHSSTGGQEQEAYNQFARKVLFQMLKCKCPVVCFNAKDFVRTVLQFFGKDGSWKHVVHFVGLDPRIAAWLIDPGDAAPSFEDLVAKYLESSISVKVNCTYGNSSRNVVNQNVRVNLKMLHRLTMGLCSQLKARRLTVTWGWQALLLTVPQEHLSLTSTLTASLSEFSGQVNLCITHRRIVHIRPEVLKMFSVG